MKKVYIRLITLISVISILLGISSCASPAAASSSASNSDIMEVHFIDVGQGDATLITCNGYAMLIDSGDDSKGTAVQNYLQKQSIKKLDYLILTHPDSDHIGGAPVIITKFDISKVFMSDYEKDNKTYRKLTEALDNKNLKYETPEAGSQYSLGTAKIIILAPNDEYDNPNDSSIALSVRNGNNTFLFTGDAGKDAEEDILDNGIDISADVYKAGHHGSRTSTSEKFFMAVSPAYAVISCAEGNSYGHPHAETLNTLRANGVKVYRTDEDGTIIAVSDGNEITFNVPASETWKAGEATGSPAASQPSSSQNEEISSGVKETALETDSQETAEEAYILNTKTKKFHKPTCNSLPAENGKASYESREDIIAQGYEPCKICNP